MTRTPQSGLSLIGVLVALFCLVTGIIIIAQMHAQNRHFIGNSRTQLQATALAGEGLELSRAYYDSLRLQNAADWTGDLCSLEGDLAIDQAPQGQGSSLVIISKPGDANGYYLNQNKNTGFISHDNSGEKTRFQRRVTVDCSENAVPVDPAANIYPLIKVTSTVSWEQGGQSDQVSLSTEFYDWHD